MVRILKVKALDEQKRHLLARSEMYRQTLTLELANIKFSAALFKRKLKAPKTILALAGLAALPAAGFLYGRGKMKTTKAPGREPRGLIPALMMGWSMFRKVAPVVQKLRQRRSASRNGRHRFAHHRA